MWKSNGDVFKLCPGYWGNWALSSAVAEASGHSVWTRLLLYHPTQLWHPWAVVEETGFWKFSLSVVQKNNWWKIWVASPQTIGKFCTQKGKTHSLSFFTIATRDPSPQMSGCVKTLGSLLKQLNCARNTLALQDDSNLGGNELVSLCQLTPILRVGKHLSQNPVLYLLFVTKRKKKVSCLSVTENQNREFVKKKKTKSRRARISNGFR